MKIYYEDSMPYAEAFFSTIGECQAFSGRSVTPADIEDADLLFVRSTTKVNEALIANCQNLKFVATATAGYNHIDQGYLKARNIPWYAAAGCNAVAVAEYVLSALCVLAERYKWTLADKTVGIVGAGQVGTALAKKLDALGMGYVLCDPPLQDAGDERNLGSLDDVMQCDVISLHVPLVKNGAHPTELLFDAARLGQLSEQQVLINACRGEIVDNAALLAEFEAGRQLKVVLDVWQNEPNISQALVPYIALATAHIAGHSLEGKANGTEMVYNAACDLLGLEKRQHLQALLPPAQPAEISLPSTDLSWQNVQYLIRQIYDIAADDQDFKKRIATVGQFEYIRKHYAIRREFAAVSVKAGNCALSQAIFGLGFKTIN
ncbi:4-phosphoerythronate dehydrogenase [Alteromonadaceae bacterium BrNp21-10]|nr:4-phosphoerythronate dehydrogenase [Alteromonadaceae bacterium BrNp21-10]